MDDRHPISPGKLLLSKWTAVQPRRKEKHFLVIKTIPPEPPATAITHVELEAVHSKRVERLDWRELADATRWKRGWL